ncbi:MAG: stage II sporulation protein M [Anaerovorax sp.]
MNRKFPIIHRKLLAFAAFFFIIGISTGVFLVVLIEDAEKETALRYLNNYLLPQGAYKDFLPRVFLCSVANNFLLLLVMALSGFFSYGLILALGAFCYKGLVLGFSATLILEFMSGKGVLLLLFTVIPQNVLFLAALAFGVAISVDLKKSPRISSASYWTSYGILSIVILVGCLLEAVLHLILTPLIV